MGHAARNEERLRHLWTSERGRRKFHPSAFAHVADMRGYEWLVGPGKALDPARQFLITSELFGNGCAPRRPARSAVHSSLHPGTHSIALGAPSRRRREGGRRNISQPTYRSLVKRPNRVISIRPGKIGKFGPDWAASEAETPQIPGSNTGNQCGELPANPPSY